MQCQETMKTVTLVGSELALGIAWADVVGSPQSTPTPAVLYELMDSESNAASLKTGRDIHASNVSLAEDTNDVPEAFAGTGGLSRQSHAASTSGVPQAIHEKLGGTD